MPRIRRQISRPVALAMALLGMTGALPAEAANASARFTAPMQPWASADGDVHLLRPAAAQMSSSDSPVGSLMTAGWHLIWDGAAPTPGTVVLRLSLPVRPEPPEAKRTEYLQIGRSRAASDVASCSDYGLHGGSGQRQADRIINGRRYTVWINGDAGMSQSITATDLRTVVNGTCYAIERFSYADTASAPDPGIRLPQAAGAAALDAALASLQLGPISATDVIKPPALTLPPGTVAR